ncbi:MAG: hypothetical protein HY013_04000 [Candidatus Solibacter usitatus]|nr:hypothetical protein [Candidatus Solibacter usitatus]
MWRWIQWSRTRRFQRERHSEPEVYIAPKGIYQHGRYTMGLDLESML